MKCVALLSGGVDSAAACMLAKKSGHEVCGLNFRRVRKEFETEYARRFAERHGINFKVVDADVTSLIREAQETSLSYVTMSGQQWEFLWGRNIIYLVLAANYAASVGASVIVVGFAPHDASRTDDPSSCDYPDCHPRVLSDLSDLLTITLHRTTRPQPNSGSIRIDAPLMDKVKTKVDVFKLALELGINIGDTISCYTPIRTSEGWRSCGQCLACHHRRAALTILQKQGFNVPLREITYNKDGRSN